LAANQGARQQAGEQKGIHRTRTSSTFEV